MIVCVSADANPSADASVSWRTLSVYATASSSSNGTPPLPTMRAVARRCRMPICSLAPEGLPGRFAGK